MNSLNFKDFYFQYSFEGDYGILFVVLKGLKENIEQQRDFPRTFSHCQKISWYLFV